MYQTVQKKRYRYDSPFDALLDNPYDEQAWYEIFGERLRTRVCSVVVRESGTVRIVDSKDYYEAYRRQNIAYC